MTNASTFGNLLTTVEGLPYHYLVRVNHASDVRRAMATADCQVEICGALPRHNILATVCKVIEVPD